MIGWLWDRAVMGLEWLEPDGCILERDPGRVIGDAARGEPRCVGDCCHGVGFLSLGKAEMSVAMKKYL
jgi:hypothetical protein